MIAQVAASPDPVIGSSSDALIRPFQHPPIAETPAPVGVERLEMVGWGLWSA